MNKKYITPKPITKYTNPVILKILKNYMNELYIHSLKKSKTIITQYKIIINIIINLILQKVNKFIMNLPIIPKKQFSHFNRYLNKKFTLVPFNQGQQSILLEVNEEISTKEELTSEDIRILVREKLEAIRQVISECLINSTIDDLPYFVVEELFLSLRAKSIGEIIELNYVCKNEIDKKECGNKLKLSIDVSKIFSEVDKDFSKEIIIYDEDDIQIGVNMKFITLDDMINSTFSDEAPIPFIMMLESIFDKEKVYRKENYSDDELKNFYDSITPEGLLELKEKFFDKLPTIQYETTLLCDKCGKEHHIKLKGLNDFFA